MPDTKATTEHPATTLKDKAPPKPRRVSSIPPALVVSGTASRIPPAPRAPRPPMRGQAANSAPTRVQPASPQMWELEDDRGDRQTLRGVAAATPPPTPQRDGAIALVGVSLAAVFLGGWWFLREPGPPAPTARVKAALTEQVAGVAHSRKAAPASQANDTDGVQPAAGSIGASIADVAEPALPSANAEASRPPSGTATIAALKGAHQSPPLDDITAPSVPLTEPASDVAPTGDAAARGDITPANTEAPTPAALPGFDAEAAKRALGASAFTASSCRKGDDPRGSAEVIVTFAPSGRVTSANVNGAPFGGTATGGCIAATLRGASVPPFTGTHVTVRKLVTVR